MAMKVVCEYCGSYVEADENMKCPLCNGALGTAVQTEQEHIEQQQEIAYQREAEAKAQEAKEDHISEVITGVANVATALAAGAGLSGVLGTSSSDDDENRPPEPPDGRRMPPPPHDDENDTGLVSRISSAASRAVADVSGSREGEHRARRDHGEHDNRSDRGPGQHGGPRGGMPGGGPGRHR